MGGASRFFSLLAAPFPPLRPSLLLLRHRISTLSTATSSPFSISSASKPIRHVYRPVVNSFHSQPNNNSSNLNPVAASQQQLHHPWPEWTHFLNFLSAGPPNHFDLKIPPEDAFVAYEVLPEDFVRAASRCLAFARERPNLLGLLTRRNIEAVVSNGTPFLFKSALDCARRMRVYVEPDQSNVSESDKATTIDLMKYIISYASNPTVSSGNNGLYSRELVDSSVRNLLRELGTLNGTPTSYTPAPEHQLSGRYGQTPRPLGRNIEMKRGDWVCSKCNFMNFARNMKCLECEEPRPKKQLTGGEWECPQCNFFNYGRNLVCLRCDCRRPSAPLFNTVNSGSGSGYNGDYTFRANIGSRLVENEEQQNQISKTFSNYGNSKGQMGQILGRSSSSPASNDTGITARQEFETGSSPPFSQSASPDDQYPSYVPTSAASFSKNGQNSDEDLEILSSRTQETSSLESRNQGTVSSEAYSFSRNFPFSKDSGGESKEHSQSEKSENWFKKVIDLHENKGVPRTISDEDFPAIMPMRTGENRFVVGKKKDRSLTSPMYKRQVALDQAKDSNFVPFVPFPPDYFARKEIELADAPDSLKTTSGTSSQKITETETVDSSRHVAAPRKDDKIMSLESADFAKRFMADTSTETRKDNQLPSTESSQFSSNTERPPISSPHRSSIMSHVIDNNSGKSDVPEYEDLRSSWRGKSLEGSAVKEPDPLDMSEEAKAERWFKRVAQIKDISELSQIPDEDFPSIMPMRKGVNRFVVSKRKTPLERRLTSQQYRRSLPIVTTDPLKYESDNNS